MRVLLIEDDPKAARLLTKGLQEEGFVVDHATTDEAKEDDAFVNEYDLILLDWLVPGNDGIAVCRSLRARDRATPLMMISSRQSVADRVNGLRTGADDYLSKPFDFV
jgi:DNA-binding response OmpR family regulator